MAVFFVISATGQSPATTARGVEIKKESLAGELSAVLYNYLKAQDEETLRLYLAEQASEQLVQEASARIEGLDALGGRIGAVFDEIDYYVQSAEISELSDNSVSGAFRVTTILFYHYAEAAWAGDYAAFSSYHYATFRKADEAWLISSDSFDEREFTGVISADYEMHRNMAHDTGDGSGTDESTYPSRSEMTEQPLRYGDGDLDIDAALQYAVTYCGFPYSIRNLNYSTGYSSGVYDNTYYNQNYLLDNYYPVIKDCANYVSQCLYAAGLPTDSLWYYAPYNPKWVGASDLAGYLRGLGYADVFVSSTFDNVFPGNPVYYEAQEIGEDGMLHTRYHQMFCIGYNAAGVPVVCAHTDDAYRMPITAYSSSYTYRTILIALSNEHSHSIIGGFHQYNAAVHYQVCEYCEGHLYQAHRIDHMHNRCLDCGATGPFLVPFE